jgi:hypothetical protein
MQTVLYVSPMELGDELQVRQIHDRFPVDALEDGIGIEQLAAFIGSGFYALELTVADGDFQEQFHRFLATPDIAQFFQELSRHITHLPLNEEGTAEMPLTTQMLRWHRGGGVDSIMRDDEVGLD